MKFVVEGGSGALNPGSDPLRMAGSALSTLIAHATAAAQDHERALSATSEAALGWQQRASKAEAECVETVARWVVEANGDTAIIRTEDPAAPTDNALGGAGAVLTERVKVIGDPLFDIPRHILETAGVPLLFSNGVGLRVRVRGIPAYIIERIAPRIHMVFPTERSPLPLCL